MSAITSRLHHRRPTSRVILVPIIFFLRKDELSISRYDDDERPNEKSRFVIPFTIYPKRPKLRRYTSSPLAALTFHPDDESKTAKSTDPRRSIAGSRCRLKGRYLPVASDPRATAGPKSIPCRVCPAAPEIYYRSAGYPWLRGRTSSASTTLPRSLRRGGRGRGGYAKARTRGARPRDLELGVGSTGTGKRSRKLCASPGRSLASDALDEIHCGRARAPLRNDGRRLARDLLATTRARA